MNCTDKTKRQVGQLVSVSHKLDSVKALEEAQNLEYTVVHNGMLLDYWTTKPTEMSPFSLVVDVAHKAAAIPGDGNTPVAFTHTSDIARYVAALLDEKKWDIESTIVGDKVTWNEFVKLAEAAQGKLLYVSKSESCLTAL
jgi:nucleoside-diphosphate-sugar epimerase